MMNMEIKNLNDQFCFTNILFKLGLCFIYDEYHYYFLMAR